MMLNEEAWASHFGQRCPSLKWLEKGCAIGEDVSGVGDYNPGANDRSLP